MAARRTGTAKARAAYARELAAAARSTDPRLERIFELVPREAFLPPGPWRLAVDGRVAMTADDNPKHLYQNALVVLDEAKGINSGEPVLHAMWIGAVAPQPGETVSHIGAGAGYYTAILSMLVRPGGRVIAYEVDPVLAEIAGRNLEPFDNVSVIHANAVSARLPRSEIIYVNAGVVAPPVSWLEALKPGGRIVFPWRPLDRVGLALMATRAGSAFSVKVLGGAWFIPCEGASDAAISIRKPLPPEAEQVRSIVLTADTEPDDSAIAVYPDLWFSSQPLEKDLSG